MVENNPPQEKLEEKRKLQELGGSLYLSLPSMWTNQFHLQKGSEVLIMQNNGALQIFPEKLHAETQKEKKTLIEYDHYFFRNLMGAYLKGSEVIVVKKKTAFTIQERQGILQCVNNLMNLEVMEEQANLILIQHLQTDMPIKKMVARMYFLTKSMLEDLGAGWDDMEMLRNVANRDTLVGKFYLAIIMQERQLLTRQWSKELSFVEILHIRLLIQKMELIGDEIKELVEKRVKREKIGFKREDIIFLVERYHEAYEAFVKADVNLAKNFWDTEKADRKRVGYNQHLVRIYDYIKDMTDLVI